MRRKSNLNHRTIIEECQQLLSGANRLTPIIIKWGITSVFFVTLSIATAQKNYITNQYVYDLYLMNPAAAAMDKGCFIANGYVQKQWTGMDDSPSTQILSVQATVNESLGSGTYIYNDKNGFYKEMGLQQTFSYEVLLSKNRDGATSLLWGLSLNLEQSTLDQSGLSEGAVLDPAFTGSTDDSGWGLNANAGVILKFNKVRTGISLTNLFSNTNSMFESEYEPTTPLDVHMFLTTTFKIPDRELYLEPIIYYRRNNGVESKMDINMKLTMPTMNDDLSFWGVLAYRRTMDKNAGVDLGSAVTLGVMRKRLSLGLEYQFGLTSAQTNYGSYYQLVLGYRFCRDKFGAALECPAAKKDKRFNEKYIPY